MNWRPKSRRCQTPIGELGQKAGARGDGQLVSTLARIREQGGKRRGTLRFPCLGERTQMKCAPSATSAFCRCSDGRRAGARSQAASEDRDRRRAMRGKFPRPVRGPSPSSGRSASVRAPESRMIPGPFGRMIATSDFSRLVNFARALANAAATQAMESLDRCMAALLDEEVEAHGAGFRALGRMPWPIASLASSGINPLSSVLACSCSR